MIKTIYLKQLSPDSQIFFQDTRYIVDLFNLLRI